MDSQIKYLLLLIAAAVALVGAKANNKQCPKNEVYKCVGCEHVCNGPWASCKKDCTVHRCECDATKGFYREYEGGPCVRREDCPAKEIAWLCGKNAVHKECAGCDPLCGASAEGCADECAKSGCVCKEGYCRGWKGGSCVSSATPKPPVVEMCPKNEVYKCVGCEHVCNGPWTSCIEDCTEYHCECDATKGFYREYEGGPCVRREDCPAKESEWLCRTNEVHKECAGCDPLCDAPAEVCADECAKPGCVCKNGYCRAGKYGPCESSAIPKPPVFDE